MNDHDKDNKKLYEIMKTLHYRKQTIIFDYISSHKEKKNGLKNLFWILCVLLICSQLNINSDAVENCIWSKCTKYMYLPNPSTMSKMWHLANFQEE